jgi:hypothetical protein
MKNRNNLGNAQLDCIEPSVGGKVYDYYNGVLSGEEVGRFERHLIRCNHCERVILELDFSLTVVNENRGAGTSSVSDASSSDQQITNRKVKPEAKRRKRG